MDAKSPSKSNRSKQRTTAYLVLFVLAMFGLTYAMVPIFTFVCEQFGINGKNGLVVATDTNNKVDMSRTIKVQFTSVLHGKFGFQFKPMQEQITIHPGEHKTIYFYAENDSGIEKTVQAIPSITPMDAARYLKKIECFCFTQQHFNKDEKAKMFVNFYIDPAISPDVKEVTLAYTLFDASDFKGTNKVVSKGRIAI